MSHPYFSEYRHLQRLCIQILRYEEIKYGRNDDEIYGVLFDGAWLWEEYVNTILRNHGYIHPQNKLHKGKISLFADGSGTRYPDFYKEDIVIDAKYKRYADMKLQHIDGDDLHQVITYMYILSARHGGFVVPGKYINSGARPEPKTLNGYGGNINIYSIIVDTLSQNYKDYCRQMCQNEKDFLDLLPKIDCVRNLVHDILYLTVSDESDESDKSVVSIKSLARTVRTVRVRLSCILSVYLIHLIPDLLTIR